MENVEQRVTGDWPALGNGFLDLLSVLLRRRIEQEGSSRYSGCNDSGDYCGFGHEAGVWETPNV